MHLAGAVSVKQEFSGGLAHIPLLLAVEMLLNRVFRRTEREK